MTRLTRPAEAALLNQLLARFPGYAAKFVPAADATVDDEFRITLHGTDTRWGVQCCEGRDYSVNEYAFDESGELDSVCDSRDGAESPTRGSSAVCANRAGAGIMQSLIRNKADGQRRPRSKQPENPPLHQILTRGCPAFLLTTRGLKASPLSHRAAHLFRDW